jgi:co-chaperonin GroES (HSP10)
MRRGSVTPALRQKRKEKFVSDKTVVEFSGEKNKKVASQLPEPCSYHILVALPEQEEKTEGGVYLTESMREREETASITAYVMALGPDCYAETPQRRFPSGVYLTESMREREETASITAYVMALGPDCYAETPQRRFPSGAYCKEGDWIVMRSYSGTRIEIHGKKFRLITDDVPQAIVENPWGVVRA